uniref:Glycosyl transferase family 51 domain-containing protein n=1 Tax=Davidia involucrata TaxID=16924 RepID=A0A5B7BA59_DAVIN
MTSLVAHSLILRDNPTLQCRDNQSPKPSNTNPTQSLTLSFSLFQHKRLTGRNSLYGRVHSAHPHRHSSSHNPSRTHFILEVLILCIFSLTLLSLRLVSNVLLPDFPRRWHKLIAFSEVAEAKFSHYPSHLWKAVVAYEDRRFFRHFGIDPVGIARAVLSLSALGGGSTITQQLVKNTFLKNERTFSRKIVEMVLALALERTIPKLRILSSYLSKIYWGHGIYGIELASNFYFGKHPTLLSLGECAMLAGIIPAPELRSPLRDPSRGKKYQVRVLKRMVEVGFLDIQTALLVVKQSLHLRADGVDYVDGLLLLVSSSSVKKGSIDSTVKEMWDWERESKIWEAREDMERWAVRIQK